jgi:serine/threonine protein kinase
MEGLACLHRRNIIHRDIKPENIILDQRGYARITDLGIARFWKPENAQETSGTPGYMAPEVLLRQNHSFCADFYAVGVIAYELLVGKRPYLGRDRKTIREEMLGR